MMPVRQAVPRIVAIGLLVGSMDALAGRVLQAQPDPSVLLSLAVTAWVAYRLAQAGQSRLALFAAVSVWIVYMTAFALCANLLVGWNGSAPWRPRSTTWLIVVAASVPVVAVIAQMAGLRAAGTTRDKASQ